MRARVDRNMTTSTARETKGGKRKRRDEKKFLKKKPDGWTDESKCKDSLGETESLTKRARKRQMTKTGNWRGKLEVDGKTTMTTMTTVTTVTTVTTMTTTTDGRTDGWTSLNGTTGSKENKHRQGGKGKKEEIKRQKAS